MKNFWDLDERCRVAEGILAQEGDNLKDLLQQLERQISPVLIGGEYRHNLMELAAKIPASAGAMPWGFEFRLHEKEPRGDFGITLLSGSKTAMFYEEKGSLTHSSATQIALANLLKDTRAEDSRLRSTFGRKVMLEFDIQKEPDETPPKPGLFLRPEAGILVGEQDQDEILRRAYDGVLSSVGWRAMPGEYQLLKQIYRKMKPNHHIDSMGAFPARERVLRTTVSGFESPNDVLEILNNLGWGRGDKDTAPIKSVMTAFTSRSVFPALTVHFDVNAESLGSTVGLSLKVSHKQVNDSKYWIDSPELWTPILDTLDAENYVNKDKLSALSTLMSPPQILYCKSTTLILMLPLHHLKFVFRENEINEVKAYVGILLCPWK